MNLNNLILNSFIKISNDSIEMVKDWRLGKKEILKKINVNGCSDIVTELDYKIESHAKEFLNKNFPDFEFVGEEGFKGDFEVFNYSYFIIDPIDGTKPFVQGEKDWGISICAVINSIPTVALLNIPDKNLIITGIAGEKIKINNTPIEIDNSKNQKVGISPRQSKMIKKYFTNSKYSFQEISALTPKVADVISNKIEAAIYFPEQGKSASIWDYAAACFLLQESGGVMKSFNGNNLPYSTDKTIHKDGWIAAKSEETFNDIKRLIEIKL